MRLPARKAAYAAGLVGLVAFFGGLPFYLTADAARKGRNLTTSEAPLPGNALVRGAFINSGSKDAGRDPDWVMDPATRRVTYVGRGPATKISPEDVERYLAKKTAAGAPPAGGGGQSPSA
jgi:hypothetical protein